MATLPLIAVNVVVFLQQRSMPPELQERFVYWFGLVPARNSLTGGGWTNWWPFVTHMFLHANWPHLVGNMWTLWIFGDNVEDRMGTGRFFLFYLLGGIVAGLAQFFMIPHARVPMVGASGAVAGVLGAYFILFPNAHIIAMLPVFFYPLFFAVPAATYLLFWFLSQWWAGWLSRLMPAQTGGVAWWAHIGGFLFGVFAHPLFVGRPRTARRRAPDEWGWEEVWQRQ